MWIFVRAQGVNFLLEGQKPIAQRRKVAGAVNKTKDFLAVGKKLLVANPRISAPRREMANFFTVSYLPPGFSRAWGMLRLHPRLSD
jgi:hypothetical protein